MPLVSVVIPAYNAAAYLGAAIESVLTQTHRDVEVIVVDDGSTDDTPQVAQAIDDPRLRLLRQANRGRSAARNQGMRVATGDYLGFLDADDLYLPTKIEYQLGAFAEHPSAGVVYSDIDLSNRDASERWPSPRALAEPPSGDVFDALVVGSFIPISSALIRRASFPQDVRFDEHLAAGEDWAFWLEAAASTAFVYAPGTVALYRLHEEMTSRRREMMWAGVLRMRQKLHELPRFATCSPAARQYSLYQLGLLECLVGDISAGHRALWHAATRQPRVRRALAALGLSILGRRALRAVLTLRDERTSWIRSRPA